MTLYLRTTRKKQGITQTEFANMLCMSLRHYQRCEEANYLPPQAAKILTLITKMKKIHGELYKAINILSVEFDNHEVIDILNKLIITAENCKKL